MKVRTALPVSATRRGMLLVGLAVVAIAALGTACTHTTYVEPAPERGVKTEGELCYGDGASGCEPGLACTNGRCVVPDKEYVSCTSSTCAGNKVTSRCSCRTDTTPSFSSYKPLENYESGCGKPPETNLPANAVQSFCCQGAGKCGCEFRAWVCDYNASAYCSCSWKLVEDIATVDLGKCEKGESRVHCCLSKASGSADVASLNIRDCSCQAFECGEGEVEVKTCAAPPPPRCSGTDVMMVSCRDGEKEAQCSPPYTPPPASSSSSSSSSGGSTSSSSSSSGGCNDKPSCTSDSDCHDKCKRCDRCSGSCVSRASC